MLAYLSRYTHRVAISNRRLVNADSNHVAFRYKDYLAGHRNRWKTMTLTVHEFIRRFILHVLPKGFHRIRHYGLFANANRADNIARARELLNAQPANDNADDGADAEPGASFSSGSICFAETRPGRDDVALQMAANGLNRKWLDQADAGVDAAVQRNVANARSIPVKKDAVFAMIEASFVQHANHEPSMLQDRRAGRKTEIETLNGAVANFARDDGLDAPANTLVAEILRLAEAGVAASG